MTGLPVRIAAQHTARGGQSERVAVSNLAVALKLMYARPGLADFDDAEAPSQAARALVGAGDESGNRRPVEPGKGAVDAGHRSFMGQALAPPLAAEQPIDLEIGKMR